MQKFHLPGYHWYAVDTPFSFDVDPEFGRVSELGDQIGTVLFFDGHAYPNLDATPPVIEIYNIKYETALSISIRVDDATIRVSNFFKQV